MNTTAFDVRAYMRAPFLLRPSDLDLETMGTLSAPAVEALTYLWAVESSILDRLRDLLVTPAHADSRVTAFLTTWTYEQHWLTTTLASVLEATDQAPETPADTPLGRIRRAWDDRARPTLDAVVTNLMGAEVTGAHMVIGWLDTAVLALAYQRLGKTESTLTGLSEAVIRMKTRHLDFYAHEANGRLASHATTRWIARAAVARWRFPGTRYTGPAAVQARVFPWFTDSAGRSAVEELDRTVAAFPGLAGARPAYKALGGHLPQQDRLISTPISL